MTHQVEMFTSLQELVLDNNNLGDDAAFPAIKDLSTLSLNKNQVSTVSFLPARIMTHMRARAQTHTHTHTHTHRYPTLKS